MPRVEHRVEQRPRAFEIEGAGPPPVKKKGLPPNGPADCAKDPLTRLLPRHRPTPKLSDCLCLAHPLETITRAAPFVHLGGLVRGAVHGFPGFFGSLRAYLTSRARGRVPPPRHRGGTAQNTTRGGTVFRGVTRCPENWRPDFGGPRGRNHGPGGREAGKGPGNRDAKGRASSKPDRRPA